MFSPRSLRLQLVVPIALVVVGTSLLFTYAGHHAMSSAVYRSARQRNRSVSDLTLDTIEHQMRSRHPADLPRSLEKIAAYPDVAAIRVLAPEGRVLLSTNLGEATGALPAHTVQQSEDGDVINDPRTGPVVHRRTAIFNRGSCRACHEQADPVIALLDVDITLRRQTAALNLWTALSSSAGLLGLIATLVAVTLAVGRFALRPIRRLRERMENVRRGDLSVVMEPVGTVEFDALADGFNAMVGQLREGAAAEQEARRLELERAEHLSAVGRLATGLAHEIRNPLSGVKAALEVLRDDMPKGEPSEILTEALTELSRIEAVVKDLLSYARPTPPSLEPADLNAIVNESAVLLAPLAAARGVVMQRELASELPPVIVDRDMMHRIIVNLAMNAIDAVQAPGTVTLGTALHDGQVFCRVHDTGPGVQLSDAAHLFEPFFTTKPRGTGLGLAISQRLIESFQGRLWLENPGQPGASFAFTLPAAAAAGV